MAEITDFPERRDQISIVADKIGEELKKMQGYKTVGPENERLIEIFGGRNIPRKFTFAHMQELLKDMSPIAGDENTIFTLSQMDNDVKINNFKDLLYVQIPVLFLIITKILYSR